jgi:uncharacterized protein YydD (DUF2326 family)
MAMASLEERVTVLEGQVKGLSEDVQHAKFTAATCMGRMDFFAENLIEVRETVTRIEKVHGDQLKEHGALLKEHGVLLKEHGALLRQILAKLG